MVRRAGLSISLVKVSELLRSKRLDPEYYQPYYQSLNEKLKSIGAVSLDSFADASDGFHESPVWVEEDGIPCISAKCVKDNYFVMTEAGQVSLTQRDKNPTKEARVGDILISSVGTIGNSAVVHEEVLPAIMDRHVGFIRIHKDKKIDPYYLAAFFNSKYGRFQTWREATGNVQLSLFIEKINKLLVPLGEEFNQIGKMVRKAYDKRRQSEQLYEDAEALLASELGLNKLDLSESLFTTQSVSQVSESRRADAEYYKRKYYNLLGHIEKRKFSTLDQVASFSGGATPLGADYLNEGIPFLRIQNVGDNRLVMDDVAFIDEGIHSSLLKRSQIQPDDVLLTITGRIGTSAVVSDDVKTGNINQHIVRMRLNTKEFNPYYLASFMNSVGGRLQTERESYGTTRDALPYYCLAKIRVLHADMKLQKEIESTIRKAEETQKEAKRLLAEAKAEVERLIEG